MMNARFGMVLLLLGSGSVAHALPIAYNPGTLNFSTTGQNMWGSGVGAAPVSKSYSTNWSSSATIGGISGSKNTQITAAIPATAAVTKQVWVPGYWDNHGKWQKHKKYGVSYWEYHSNWKKHNGYNKTVTLFPAQKGVPAQTMDTRTGSEVTFSSSGSVGLTSSLGFNGGTVDAEVAYDARLALPDQLAVGEYFKLNPYGSISSARLQSQFPKLVGSVDVNLAAKVDVADKTCFAGLGCSTGGSNLLNIAPTDLNILKINTADLPADKMSVFGLDDMAFDATRGKIYADMVVEPGGTVRPVVTLPFMTPPLAAGMTFGDVELDYPDFGVNGTLQNGKIVASGRVDNIVSINADIDATATLQSGAPVQGGVVYAQPLTFRGDVLDIDLGPTMDLSQSLELDPTLMVDLAFDHAVTSPSGDEINFWRGVFSEIPEFALHDEHAVTVTPTYWLDAMLSNQASLDFDLTFSLDILKGSVNTLGIDLANYVMKEMRYSVDMGSADIFRDTFSFGGFGRITADPFVLAANRRPQILSANNGTRVPEPATLLLFAIGLAGLARKARRS